MRSWRTASRDYHPTLSSPVRKISENPSPCPSPHPMGRGWPSGRVRALRASYQLDGGAEDRNFFYWRVNRKSKIVNPGMPIYEFACPKCRRIFNFLSKRLNPDRLPTCPRCGNKKMAKQMSRFAMTKGLKEPAAKSDDSGDEPMPDMDDPRVMRAMSE